MSDAPPILVAGEALYDVIAGAGDDPTLSGHAGGGPFNIARTLGRLRQPVAFLGRVSTDRLGMTHTHDARSRRRRPRERRAQRRSDDARLASLDAEGVARWSFYSADTAAAGLTPETALAALPPRVAALHVGTLGLVLEPLGDGDRGGGAAARRRDDGRPGPERPAAGDPRPGAFRARLERVIARSHLVKVSEEDVAWLDPGSTTSDAARALLARGASAVLLTRGAAGATVLTDGRQTPIDAVPTKVADTIGAGDAFGGGMLAWWISHGLGRAQLADHALVVEAARFGATVAARTVAQPGASPPQLPASAAGRPLMAADLDVR